MLFSAKGGKQMEEDRVRKKRREEKVHFSGRGWNNTYILSENTGEQKENRKRKIAAGGNLQR